MKLNESILKKLNESEENINKQEIFNIIDELLQECYIETIDREDYNFDKWIEENIHISNEKDIDKVAELIYNNVEIYVSKLKDKLSDEI